MRVLALLSGGKDSVFAMQKCLDYGHEVVAIGNIRPAEECGADELDSEMYQTVGWNAVSLIAQALDLPFFQVSTKGHASQRTVAYCIDSSVKHDGVSSSSFEYGEKERSKEDGSDGGMDEDEVHDLHRLIRLVQEKHHIDAVCSGAILSNYQRCRVEAVCSDLGLVSLAYLWERSDQSVLLKQMLDSGIQAMIIKCASYGLSPHKYLGRIIDTQVLSDFEALHDEYGMNVCGEGGEFETLVLDCALFKVLKLHVGSFRICGESLKDPISPSGHLSIDEVKLIPKEPAESTEQSQTVPNSEIDTNDDCHRSDAISTPSSTDVSSLKISSLRVSDASLFADAYSDQSSAVQESRSADETSSASSSLRLVGRRGSTDESIDTPLLRSPVECAEIVPLSEVPFCPFRQPRLIDKSDGIFGQCNVSRNEWNGFFQFVAHPNRSSVAQRRIEPLSDWELREEMTDLFNELKNALTDAGLSLSHVFYTQLFVRDMDLFSEINELYKEYFGLWLPPSRVCIEIELTGQHRFTLEALAYSAKCSECDVLHVQSISDWAPSCIGPYSQATSVRKALIFAAGQIALSPPTMRMVNSVEPVHIAKRVISEVNQTLWNMQKVLATSAMDSDLACAIHHNVFVLHQPSVTPPEDAGYIAQGEDDESVEDTKDDGYESSDESDSPKYLMPEYYPSEIVKVCKSEVSNWLHKHKRAYESGTSESLPRQSAPFTACVLSVAALPRDALVELQTTAVSKSSISRLSKTCRYVLDNPMFPQILSGSESSGSCSSSSASGIRRRLKYDRIPRRKKRKRQKVIDPNSVLVSRQSVSEIGSLLTLYNRAVFSVTLADGRFNRRLDMFSSVAPIDSSFVAAAASASSSSVHSSEKSGSVMGTDGPKTQQSSGMENRFCSFVSFCEMRDSPIQTVKLYEILKGTLFSSVLGVNGYAALFDQKNGEYCFKNCLVSARLYYHCEVLEPVQLARTLEKCFRDQGFHNIPAVSLVPCRQVSLIDTEGLGLYLLHMVFYDQILSVFAE